MKYSVRIPDFEYYQEQIKCQAACPVRTDARGYVTAIATGDLAAAYAIARTPNPLSSVCGRVCNAPCEVACRRGNIDASVAIRPLKRIATERYGVESRSLLPKLQTTADDSGQTSFGNITIQGRETLKALATQPGRKRGRVAVIGSGPAGLSCAHDLAMLNHDVTIYDASSAAGGMLRVGIPVYRLDRELLGMEIENIQDLGVALKLNTMIGDGLPFATLREDFDAIFIATGLGEGRSLGIPGADLDGVLNAVDFLLNVNMGYKVDLGKQVVVIGGGNVAVDAARMAIRQHQAAGAPLAEIDPLLLETATGTGTEPDQDESLHAAIDVARTALRLGVADVHMIALESWDELPASELEIRESLEEGIAIHAGYGPQQIMGIDGHVVGLMTRDVVSVFDENGRFNPKFAHNSERTWPCDTIILAIGQAANLDFLGQDHGVQISARGLIVADGETGATNAPGVYAGGDVVYGPRILIDAVRDGQCSARAIDSQIQEKRLSVTREVTWTMQTDHRMPDGYLSRERSPVPTLPLNRRMGITEVELGYDDAVAQAQAERCLNCGINPVFDARKCILCGGCVDVCPWDCLKIVRVADLAGDSSLDVAVKAVYGMDRSALLKEAAPAAAMLKDETLCTRCGLCAQRCPTGSITMETFSFRETLQYDELEQ